MSIDGAKAFTLAEHVRRALRAETVVLIAYGGGGHTLDILGDIDKGIPDAVPGLLRSLADSIERGKRKI